MNALDIIKKYYKEDSDLYNMLVSHSNDVMHKAIEIALKHPELGADINFIGEAAMLHDIGLFLTDVPSLGCQGIMPYMCHGYIGREIMEKEGFPKHAIVCETHVGVGLRKEDIEEMRLPLPKRDMIPQTIEEEIIAFADLFFSKNNLGYCRSVEEVAKNIEKYENPNAQKVFKDWCSKFL